MVYAADSNPAEATRGGSTPLTCTMIYIRHPYLGWTQEAQWAPVLTYMASFLGVYGADWYFMGYPPK